MVEAPDKHSGQYLGTEIDSKWWKRYAADGLLARGLGEYWFDGYALYFRRKLTEVPIVIPYVSMLGVQLGTWHGGRWAGGVPILKVLWDKDGCKLSSGFIVSKNRDAVQKLAEDLGGKIRQVNAS